MNLKFSQVELSVGKSKCLSPNQLTYDILVYIVLSQSVLQVHFERYLLYMYIVVHEGVSGYHYEKSLRKMTHHNRQLFCSRFSKLIYVLRKCAHIYDC